MEAPWVLLIEEKIEAWWKYGIHMLPNLILALFILTLFIVAAKYVRNITARLVFRLSKSRSVSGLASGALYSLVIIAGVMSALDILELDKTVSSLLAGVGIIGLALGFAFQDLTSNFISGAFIALKRPFDVGHTVETNGFLGTIEDIQLRATILRTSAGLHVIIPNKDIFQKPIINYSRTDARRIEFEFILPNSVSTVFVEKLVRESLEKLTVKNSIRNIDFYYVAIETPNMRANVSFWTNRIDPRDFMKARHEAITSIYQAFTDNKIYQVQIPESPSISS